MISSRFPCGQVIRPVHAAPVGRGYQADQYADRGGSLPDSARNRRLRVATKTEALQRVERHKRQYRQTPKAEEHRINVRGTVVSMNESFCEFGVGLIVVDCAGLSDPDGAVRFIRRSVHHPDGDSSRTGRRGDQLLITGSTLNIMSLMGVIMMTGIVVSNSILIVDFGICIKRVARLLEARFESCKIRLRPI